MSLLPGVRDYIEFLNTLSESFGNQLSVTKVLSETFVYILKTFQYGFVYFFSFQWLRDFSLLPILIPQATKALFTEHFFLENPSHVVFDLVDIPQLQQNTFFVGFCNSFFLALPISVIHLIAIRRFYIKGIPSAVWTLGGYFSGQLVFIFCVVFGIRHVLVPWLTFEPLNYLLGCFLLFRLLYKTCSENLTEILGWNHPSYRQYAITSFILAWCEQTALFQYLGNLTLSPNSSLLESIGGGNWLGHGFYVIGLTLGCIIFSLCWGGFFFLLRSLLLRYTSLMTSKFVQTVHRGSIIFSIALTLSSIPFYGIDYLTTNAFGFISQDKAFKGTIFDSYNIRDGLHILGPYSDWAGLELDVSSFDRGRYLIYPVTATGPLSFEDLNYRAEADWTARQEKRASVSDSRGKFFAISKLLKRPSDEKDKDTKFEGQSGEEISQEAENLFPLKAVPPPEETEVDIDIDPEDPNREMTQRFYDWYGFSVPKEEEDGGINDDIIFADFQQKTFPPDFLRFESPERGMVDFLVKHKYYSNPIYQNLLQIDIDAFLNRQPGHFQLTGEQEQDLVEKRQMLMGYLDSLNSYAELPYEEDFDDFFEGSKSFTNKVYNQQFKGTLRSVARLFSLTLEDDDVDILSGSHRFSSLNYTSGSDSESAFEMDASDSESTFEMNALQPIVQTRETKLDTKNPFGSKRENRETREPNPSSSDNDILGSEQSDRDSDGESDIESDFDDIQKTATPSILKFDQPLYTLSTNPASTFHEEIPFSESNDVLESSDEELIGDLIRSPLYAGWNSELRKFVVTNKLLPRQFSGRRLALEPGMQKQFKPDRLLRSSIEKRNERLGKKTERLVRNLPENQSKNQPEIKNVQQQKVQEQTGQKQNEIQKIRFTAWPLPADRLVSKSTSQIPFVTLFETSTDEFYKQEGIGDWFDEEDDSTLPPNLQRIVNEEAVVTQFDYLAPQRGGFLWPGNAKPQFSLLQSLQTKVN
jgi:hypothetical protein